MKNKEKVFLSLKGFSEHLGEKNKYGITAEEIAADLCLKRNVVSHLLNELYIEGKAIKINTRPVYYIDKDIYENKKDKLKAVAQKKDEASIASKYINNDPFKKLIGYNGSLKTQIEQCKSAVSYPPKGLPVLITGETGVGKSFAAQLIYDYAKQTGAIHENAPYVVFNCAEYANNPELLTANLMGYQKGTFTGADKDRIGLLEEANGGYLFLDEVHRLPPEGQEKLFMFMDRGVFRRLGETGKWRSANVRLIFATTEDLKNYFLDTFLRRIPIIVNMPPFSERPVYERLQLIYYVYREEAKNINKDIIVSKQILNVLMKAKISGNIGKLINIIKYSCAHAYNMIEPVKIKTLRIHMYDLPSDALENYGDTSANGFNFNPMFIDRNHEENPYDGIKDVVQINKINRRLMELISSFASGEITPEVFKKNSLEHINEFSDEVVFRDGRYRTNPITFNVIVKVVENVLKILEASYGIKYYANTTKVLSHYTNYFVENIFEVSKNEKLLLENNLDILKKVYPREYTISSKMINIIETNLDIKFGEKPFIYFTLYMKSICSENDVNVINSIIISHGYSTASSIASAANRLLGCFVFEAFDVPLDMPVKDIVLIIEEYLKTVDTSKGVIILVDMGSLEEIYKPLVSVVKGDIGIINNVNTRLAIDVGERVIKGQPMGSIITEAVKQNSCLCKYIKTSEEKKSAILITCAADMVAAEKIRNLLYECLKGSKIEIMPYEYGCLKNNGEADEVFKAFNVKLIIGTSDPRICNVPYLSLEDLIMGRSEAVLTRTLKGLTDENSFDQINEAVVKMFSLQNIINHLTILNPDKIIDQAEGVINGLEIGMNKKFTNDLKISLYIHISCLIERMVTKDTLIEIKGIDEFKTSHIKFVKIFEEAFSMVESIYKVQMPESEIAIIYEIIHQKINDMNL